MDGRVACTERERRKTRGKENTCKTTDRRIILKQLRNVGNDSDGIGMAQDTNRSRAVVNGSMNCRIAQNAGNCLIGWGTVDVSAGLRVSDWVSEWVWVSEGGRSEGVSECVYVGEWVSVWVSECEWVREWVCEWVSEWVNELPDCTKCRELLDWLRNCWRFSRGVI